MYLFQFVHVMFFFCRLYICELITAPVDTFVWLCLSIAGLSVRRSDEKCDIGALYCIVETVE